MFDRYICRRDDSRRGRGDDEVPRMLEASLRAHGISADRVTVIVDEQEAIEAALRQAQPGDLVLIFADALARGWKQITQFKPDAALPSLASQKKQVPQTIAPDAEELADDNVPPPAAPKPAPLQSPAIPASPRETKAPSTISDADGSATIVRDDRGVFLAREAND
jgi:cyanophycin synthetase